MPNKISDLVEFRSRARVRRRLGSSIALLGALFVLSAGAAHADVTLPGLFQDHMVLQESAATPVWGTAKPGETVTVTIGGRAATARADQSGHWRAIVDLHGKAGGPYQLVVQGRNRIAFSDVLIGDVWLASGQSNMEFSLFDSADGKDEVAASANPELRQFKVAKVGAAMPESDCKGAWTIAGPATSRGFTAVGYYFAKEVQRQTHRPIALISSYYGGSNIESWLSESGIEKGPFKDAAAALTEEARTYPERQQRYENDYKDWQAKYSRVDLTPEAIKGEADRFAAVGLDTTDWRPVQITGTFAEPTLISGGAVWLRKTVRVTPEMAGAYLPLHLGSLHEFDQVYWNGVLVGATTAGATTGINVDTHSSSARRYDVAAPLVKAGVATIAIRIFNPVGPPAIEGMPASETADPAFGGIWLTKVESALPPLGVDAKASFPKRPPLLGSERNRPGALFNAMIAPLLPCAIRGIVWYQGESNTGRAFQYRTLFPQMIADWRAQWHSPDLPFYFCQLANLGPKFAAPRESGLAELRDAQSLALTLPQTGEAVTLDVGEEADVHYRDKKTVGLRLARIALAKTYGEKIVYSGPTYASSERDGAAMRIHFRFVENGLKAAALPASYKRKSTLATLTPLVRNSPNSELEGFQICGADHKWVWADAKIDGETVLVSSPMAPDPVAVRYAWSDNPTVNLYNDAGLPAAPFRTDDFPEVTRSARFQ